MTERDIEYEQDEPDAIRALDEPEVVPDPERVEEGIVDPDELPVQEDDERGDDVEPLGGEEVV